jgi:acetyl esterase/lipase
MSAAEIHPDLQRAARFLPRGGLGPRGAAFARTVQPILMRRTPPGVSVVRLDNISIRVHVHHPTHRSTKEPATPAGLLGVANEPGPVFLWIHGGGYILGTASQDDPLCAQVARDLGVTVAAVDYRLAPRFPYPTPLEDCYAALVWLAAQPFADPARVAIGGASAGGGLAAGLALLARDRGEVSPALQLLAYPMLDDRTALRGDIDQRGFRLWNNHANAFGWRCYTGLEPGDDAIDGYAAPARHADLAGVAPAWIGIGTQDLFHDEDLVYAERLKAAGVKCDLEVVAGAFHGFDAVAPKAPVTKQFRVSQLDALRAALLPA